MVEEKKFITLSRQLCRSFCAVSLFLFFILFIFFVNATLAQAADRYWVGDTGNWSDAGNHWASSSGGSPDIANLPTSLDNVYFDANSFTTTGQVVEIDVPDAYCADMDWTGVLHSPELHQNNTGFWLRIYGSLTMPSSVTVAPVNFQMDFETQGNQTLDSAAALAEIFLGDSGEFTGTLTIVNNLTTQWWIVSNPGAGGGTINFGSASVNIGFAIFLNNDLNVEFGSSTVDIEDTLQLIGSTVNFGTASITTNSTTDLFITLNDICNPDFGSASFNGRGVSYNIQEIDCTLEEDLNIPGVFFLQDNVTFNANGYNVTANSLYFSAFTGQPTVNMGSGTWETNGHDNEDELWPWAVEQYNDNVVNFITGSSTIKLSDSSSNTKTFYFYDDTGNEEGKTYNNLWLTGTGTGNFIIQGSNTFTDFKIDPGKTVVFVGEVTQTLNSFTATGSAGNLITLFSADTNGGTFLSGSIVAGGQDYLVGDEIYVDGGNNDAILTVTGVDGGGAITSFNISNGGTAYFVSSTSGSETTTTNGIGTGFLVRILDVSSNMQFNLSKSSGTVESDYLHVSNSNVVGGAEWYAGENSVDNANNSGWVFTAPPGDTTPPTPNPPIITALNILKTSINWTLSIASDLGVGLHSAPYGFSSNSGGPYTFQNTNDLLESGLICDTPYTKYGVLRDLLGNQTSEGSANVSTAPCVIPVVGGGSVVPVGSTNLPVIPANGFKIFINYGASTTYDRIVNLSFNAGTDVKNMAISLNGDFKDTGQEDYWPTKQIDLCSKYGGAVKNPTCPDGQYTVYVKFYTGYGVASDIFSSKINLATSSNTSVSSQPSIYNLGTATLKNGSKGELVKELQRFLNTELNLGLVVDGKFGPKTFTAVKKWQIGNELVPDGIVGPKTKAKIYASI